MMTVPHRKNPHLSRVATTRRWSMRHAERSTIEMTSQSRGDTHTTQIEEVRKEIGTKEETVEPWIRTIGHPQSMEEIERNGDMTVLALVPQPHITMRSRGGKTRENKNYIL